MQKFLGIVLVAALVIVESTPLDEPAHRSQKSSVPQTRPSPAQHQEQHGAAQLTKSDRSGRHARSSPEHSDDVKILPIRDSSIHHDDSSQKEKQSSEEILKIDHNPSSTDSNERLHPVPLGLSIQRQTRDTHQHSGGSQQKSRDDHHDARNSHLTASHKPNNQHDLHQQPKSHPGLTRDVPKKQGPHY